MYRRFRRRQRWPRWFGVFAPMVGGADNDTVDKRLLAGRGEKAVNLAFL